MSSDHDLPNSNVPNPSAAQPHEDAGQQPVGYPQASYGPPDYPPPYSPSYPPADYPASYPTSAYPSSEHAAGAGYPAANAFGPGYTQPFPPTGGPYPGGPVDPPRNSSQPGRGRIVLVAAVVAAVVGGGIGAGTVAAFGNNDKTIASGVSVTTQTAQNTAKIDGTVTAAAAKIGRSVVTINVAGQNESGTGSGVILRSDGYILTNDHVVAVASGGGSIQVVTKDGQSGKAKVVGEDASDDLAVIKVDGLANLTAATFAKSSELQVGQTVVAVGAPLGLSNTVTSGIVSDLARPVQTGDGTSSSAGATFNAIQTDAAINPGNSGGPLVDLNGNVVGINAAIASANSGGVTVPGQSTQSGSIGIGFSIPSDEASRIAAELIATGKATHAVIGVSVGGAQSATNTVGATLSAVTKGGPADNAGLQVGDVVTKVGNQLITQDVDLVAAIRSFTPGATVDVTYTRAGASHTVNVTTGTAAS